MSKLDQDKKGKKIKVKRDPDAPKKGKSAFLFYLDSKLDECKRANPDLKHKEIVSKLSKMWKDLTENEKEPYIALANRAKEEYHKQKIAYAVYKKSGEKEKFGMKSDNDKRKYENDLEDEPKISKKIKSDKENNGQKNAEYSEPEMEGSDDDDHEYGSENETGKEELYESQPRNLYQSINHREN